MGGFEGGTPFANINLLLTQHLYGLTTLNLPLEP